MKLSNDTIDRIADKMVQPLVDQMTSLRASMGGKASEYLIANYVPDDVIKVAKKHPEMVCCHSIYLSTSKDSDSVTIEAKLPCGGLFVREFTALTKDAKARTLDVESNLTVYDVLRATKRSTRNRIRCTLQELRTDAKIKKEFPEAYKVYCELMDLPSESMCDNVEKLRADLSVITKVSEVK